MSKYNSPVRELHDDDWYWESPVMPECEGCKHFDSQVGDCTRGQCIYKNRTPNLKDTE